MHYLVNLIVEAKNADEANEAAVTIMDDLVEWHEFDWYTVDSEQSRWEGCWQPVRLNTKAARALVQTAMDEQYLCFKDTLETIRLMLENHTDEQIFNEVFDSKVTGRSFSRYQLYKASGYAASACQIFGQGGEYITSQRVLDMFLANSKNLWLVQVDCHN